MNDRACDWYVERSWWRYFEGRWAMEVQCR